MREEKVLRNATICYFAQNGKILLALKTKKIGQGSWNGYGGGIEVGESPIESAIREIREEAGVNTKISDYEKIAIVDFHNTKSDGEVFVCRCHIYLIKKWDGEIKESDEMITPTWFSVDDLPFEKMMPSDKDWLPFALAGKRIYAKAYLGPFQKEKLKETEIYENKNIDIY